MGAVLSRTGDDLYSKILGLAPGPRPSDHYTLLGLARFKRDAKAIHRAGLKCMKALRKWDLHPDAATQAEVQKRHNQVGAAIATLEDVPHRQRYEEALARELGLAAPSQEAVARRLPGDGLRVAQPVTVQRPAASELQTSMSPAETRATVAAAAGPTPTPSAPEEPPTVDYSIPADKASQRSPLPALAGAAALVVAVAVVAGIAVWQIPALRVRLGTLITRPLPARPAVDGTEAGKTAVQRGGSRHSCR